MKLDQQRKLARIRRESVKRIAKTEQLQIRLDVKTWDALLKLSGRMQLPVSTLAREWIKERLAVECSNSDITGNGAGRSGSIEKRLSILEQKVQLAVNNMHQHARTKGLTQLSDKKIQQLVDQERAHRK